MDQQKPKTQVNMTTTRKYEEGLSHDRHGLVDESVPDLQSREQRWYRVSTTFLLTSRRTETATSASVNQNDKGSLQKTHRYSRAKSGTCCWFNNSGSQSS